MLLAIHFPLPGRVTFFHRLDCVHTGHTLKKAWQQRSLLILFCPVYRYSIYNFPFLLYCVLYIGHISFPPGASCRKKVPHCHIRIPYRSAMSKRIKGYAGAIYVPGSKSVRMIWVFGWPSSAIPVIVYRTLPCTVWEGHGKPSGGAAVSCQNIPDRPVSFGSRHPRFQPCIGLPGDFRYR